MTIYLVPIWGLWQRNPKIRIKQGHPILVDLGYPVVKVFPLCCVVIRWCCVAMRWSSKGISIDQKLIAEKRLPSPNKRLPSPNKRLPNLNLRIMHDYVIGNFLIPFLFDFSKGIALPAFKKGIVLNMASLTK